MENFDKLINIFQCTDVGIFDRLTLTSFVSKHSYANYRTRIEFIVLIVQTMFNQLISCLWPDPGLICINGTRPLTLIPEVQGSNLEIIQQCRITNNKLQEMKVQLTLVLWFLAALQVRVVLYYFHISMFCKSS